MASQVHLHSFDNGLTLVLQPMSGVQSATMSLLLPAGAASDPEDALGSATVLAEWALRGAGSRNSRELVEHLDTLGLQRSSSVGIYHSRLSCSAVASNVMDGLDAFADIVQRPRLEDDEFEPTRELSVQALAGLDDDPRGKLLIELRKRFWPAPYNRNAMGEVEHLEKLTPLELRRTCASRYVPSGAILSLAGAVDVDQTTRKIEQLFGHWSGSNPLPSDSAVQAISTTHLQLETEQTHLGIACEAIPETHADFYNMRVAVEILGGGMSGRLFTEVREKRGLCYGVHASYGSLKNVGGLFCYSGTSTDRAQKTLDQIRIEIDRLAQGVNAGELNRAKIGLKASLIMSGESSGARAGAIAHDVFSRGRVRSLEEIIAAIDAITLEGLNAFLAANRFGPFTLVTIGSAPLS